MGKINASDKSCLKTRKKRENMEIKEIFTYKLHLKDGFGMKFTAF